MPGMFFARGQSSPAGSGFRGLSSQRSAARFTGGLLLALALAGSPQAQELAGCTENSADDLAGAGAGRVITFTCCSYTPKCIRIAEGQAVSFEGTFAAHPLRPIPAEGNPIQNQDSGSSVQFTFTTSGDFGFYCNNHGNVNGSGMAGAIFVNPPGWIFEGSFDDDGYCDWSSFSGGDPC